MKIWQKTLLIQLWFFIGFPLLGWALIAAFGLAGAFLLFFLLLLWVWQIFAFNHYRYTRQEEFVHVLHTAAMTHAPIEAVLRAYLLDRPREHLYRAILLTFVFPGFYWIHLQRSFDVRLTRLADMLEGGVPLDRALSRVPSVVPTEVALAIAVGQFTGKLDATLQRISDRRASPLWVEWMRLLYPFLVMAVLALIMSFVMIFIIPKFEKIYLEFRLKLPYETEVFIAISRFFTRYSYILPLYFLGLLLAINGTIVSSRVRWHLPIINWFYRMDQRGRFLQILGIMLESGKPVPEILEYLIESGFLVTALKWRVQRLALDLSEGEPLADSLVRHGLMKESMRALVISAEKARNLPMVLKEMGEAQIRQGARLSQRLSVILFPLAILLCSCVIGLVAYAMFSPLVALIDGVHDMR